MFQHLTLNTLFRANAVFSILCAIDLIVFPQAIAELTGIAFPNYLLALGGGLALFAGYLLWIASKPVVHKSTALQIIIADALWVIVSAVILTLDPFGLTLFGYAVLASIAAIVAVFATLQLRTAKRQCNITAQ